MIWEADCGDFRLLAIQDGWFSIAPVDFFPGSDPEEWARNSEYLEEDGSLRINLGCYLFLGPSAVMVDTGAGSDWNHPARGESGRLPGALARLGVDPGEVEAVVHTHLHADHFGGDLTPDRKPFFSAATYYVHRRELDHWLHLDGPRGDRVREGFGPLVEQGRVEPLDGDRQVVPGVTAVETPGHTPGHVSVVAVSQSRRTYLLGDVSHHPFQLRHPHWGVSADTDPKEAAGTRLRIWEALTGSGTRVAAGHYPPPGLGTVEVDAGQRVFIPAEARPVSS